MLKLLRHLLLVCRHRWLMFRYCFRIGLIKAAFFHDLSKFSWAELKVARFYQGNKSPISVERNTTGYSAGYLHHCGRNKHHVEYWTDFRSTGINRIKIPFRYLAEMAIDMIVAGKVYLKKKWTKEQPYLYWTESINQIYFHPSSRQFMEEVFRYLKEQGLKKTLKRKLLKQLYHQTNDNQPITSLLGVVENREKI